MVGGKEMQPDVVNLLTVFMVAVLAVFDYFTGFPNNTVMVEESYNYLMAAKSWQIDLLDLPTGYTRRVSCYWLQAGIEHIWLCLPAVYQTKSLCHITSLCSQWQHYISCCLHLSLLSPTLSCPFILPVTTSHNNSMSCTWFGNLYINFSSLGF